MATLGIGTHHQLMVILRFTELRSHSFKEELAA
jgi:hypothetical protein